MAVPTPLQEPPDFSLVLGGPLYQMLRRARLTGPALELLRRRIVISVFLCWVPLAVLSLAQAHFLGGAKLSFFRDISANTSFDMKCVNRSLTIGRKAAALTPPQRR